MENLIKKHKKMFGVEPKFIVMFWQDTEKEFNSLFDAIEKGIPYDEYKMLTKSEQEAFDKGELIF
jgi:hypothetical protein